MRQYHAIIKRPQTPSERANGRQGNVVAKIRGWNDTHVVFDLFIDGKLSCENYARPIERFMCCYGLNGF